MDLNGPPVKLFCPNDLQFNPIMQKCDDPSKVATVKPECVKSFTSTNNVVSKLSKVNSGILYICMNTIIICKKFAKFEVKIYKSNHFI